MQQRLSGRLKNALFGNADRISGGFLVIVSGIAVTQAVHLPFGSVRAPDAGFFPQCLSILLLIFGGGIFLRSLVAPAESAPIDSRPWQVVIAAAALIAYAIALNKVGYVLATIAIMLLIMRGLGGMTWTRALLIAVPSVVVSYLGFIELGVPLPQGLLPF